MSKLTEKDIMDILAISIIDLHGSELLTKITEMSANLLSYKQLEEKTGCPLEILNEIKKEKQIYIDTYIVQRPSGCNMTISKGRYKVIGIDILNNKIQCVAQFSDCCMEFCVSTYEYKVGWFLKEDRSE